MYLLELSVILKQRFDLVSRFANTLDEKNGELTGLILGKILDARQNEVILQESSTQRKYSSRTSDRSR